MKLRMMLLLLISFAATAFYATQAHAVLPQFVCTAPGVTPGSHCTAPVVSDWVYGNSNIGYGKSDSNRYYSEAAANAALPPMFFPPNGSWCTMTNAGSYVTQTITNSAGIVTMYRKNVAFNVTAHVSGGTPCTQSFMGQVGWHLVVP